MKKRLLSPVPALLCLTLLLGGFAFPGTVRDSSSPSDDFKVFQELFFPEDRGKYDEEGYPDWYGGAFMNQDTHLCILVVEGNEEKLDEIREAMAGRKVDFLVSRFSLNELNRTSREVVDELLALDIPGFEGVLLSQMENRVLLRLHRGEEGGALLAALQGKYPCLEFDYNGERIPYAPPAPETTSVDGGTPVLLLILPPALLAAGAALRLLAGRKRRES